MPPLLCALLLALPALPAADFEPAPWYVRYAQQMPAGVLLGAAGLAALLWLLKKPAEAFVTALFDQLVERIKRSSKEPVSPAELARKARKAVLLEQTAERLRLEIRCDHVEVYGCQNGEYLRSGEGVDKFVIQAEAARPGDPRYMDTERLIFAQDLPRAVAALSLPGTTYLLLWAEHCDDWKANKLMRERDYTSSIAVFLRRPVKAGSGDTGVIGLCVLSWRATLVYRPDQADALPKSHAGPTRLLEADMDRLVAAYAAEFSYGM